MYFKGLLYLCHPVKYMLFLYYIECSLLSFCLCKIICYPSDFKKIIICLQHILVLYVIFIFDVNFANLFKDFNDNKNIELTT